MSQDVCSLPAGKVRESTTSSTRGMKGRSANPAGRWSGFESGRALTYCRQSQRKQHYKFRGRRQKPVSNSVGHRSRFESVDCSPKYPARKRRYHKFQQARRSGSVSHFNGAMEEVLRRFDSFLLLTSSCQTRHVAVRFQTWRHAPLGCWILVLLSERLTPEQ